MRKGHIPHILSGHDDPAPRRRIPPRDAGPHRPPLRLFAHAKNRPKQTLRAPFGYRRGERRFHCAAARRSLFARPGAHRLRHHWLFVRLSLLHALRPFGQKALFSVPRRVPRLGPARSNFGVVFQRFRRERDIVFGRALFAN